MALLQLLARALLLLLLAARPATTVTQQRQCQPRESNPFMPLFHIVGNFSQGGSAQPDSINDVSAVLLHGGVLHVFHQFSQTGWAHAVSADGGAHWRNLPHALVPDRTHTYDGRGSDDGSLTVHPGVNGGEPIILYDIAPAPAPPLRLAAGAAQDSAARAADRPLLAVARAADPSDPLLEVWTKDPQNPVSFDGGPGACFPSSIWPNGQHWNFIANGVRFFTDDPTMHSWRRSNKTASEGFPAGGRGGQWFVPLPNLTAQSAPLKNKAENRAPRRTAPTHLINVNQYTGDKGGNIFELGIYHPVRKCLFPGVVILKTECLPRLARDRHRTS